MERVVAKLPMPIELIVTEFYAEAFSLENVILNNLTGVGCSSGGVL